MTDNNEGWISVKERYPDDLEYVIVTNMKQVIMCRYYAFDKSFVLSDKTLYVTHWMALPSPPRTKE